jgi:hypothetical protein
VEDKKIFYAMIAGDILGTITPIHLSVDEHRYSIYRSAVDATQRFNNIVNDSSATSEAIISSLRDKNTHTRNFEKSFGVKWPL